MAAVTFDEVVATLRHWRGSLTDRLRDPATRDQALSLMRKLDDAIGCLGLCQRHQIPPDARVTVLPDPQTRSPSSEFRLVEDHETERREDWAEVMLDGAPVRPSPGSLIVERPEPLR